MAEARTTNSSATTVLGLLVGGLLGLGAWFVQGNPLWIAAGLAIGLLGGMLGSRGNNADAPAP